MNQNPRKLYWTSFNHPCVMKYAHLYYTIFTPNIDLNSS